MANYSYFERLLASTLSKFPSLKRNIKRVYTKINYHLAINRKSVELTEDSVLESVGDDNSSTFFGYYDKSPLSEDGKYCIYHRTNLDTSKLPSFGQSIELVVEKTESKKVIYTLNSYAFNWQQGSKLHWISDNKFIYNDRGEFGYVSKIFSVDEGRVIKQFDKAVYDSFKDMFGISLSFEALQVHSPDYGYYFNEISGQDVCKDTGIDLLCYSTGAVERLLSIENIIEFESSRKGESYFCSDHTVNHIMLSPTGDKFIFIHRWYEKGVRFDRLLSYSLDKKNLALLIDQEMVSHCCWISNTEILGYFRFNGKNRYYTLDVESHLIQDVSSEDLVEHGDGHPSLLSGTVVVTDSYPNRKGQQSLLTYDYITKDMSTIAKFSHPPKFFGSGRCDLHPRVAKHDSRLLFVDSVHSGQRRLYRIYRGDSSL
ncbi:hypothetical protein AAFX23_05855 [Vibrio alginolyticus]|uniref:hypothetical protein n=1 Tax=Vibrio alginolyticus TaxID=663 RepID=UPI0038CDB3E0|nr:hypothetical protein [Vibrio alginolyticus]